MIESSSAAVLRIDRWLWMVRIYKTRPLATEACNSGAVRIGTHEAKPARPVRAGEIIDVRQGVVNRSLRVLGIPTGRIGAARVPEFCAELTSPAEWAKAREWTAQQILSHDRRAGRPTKRDRRLRDRLEQ